MITISMVTGRRDVDEGTDKLFVESLSQNYEIFLIVLYWVNFGICAIGSGLCCTFWYDCPSFRMFGNYNIFNLLFSLTMYNGTKMDQLLSPEHATICSFFIRLSMGWFLSWFFVMCFHSLLNHTVKGIYVLDHKYWKTNILAVGFALVLTVGPSYLSRDHYLVLSALISMPGYAAYLTTIMSIVEVLITKEKRKSNWRMVKSFTYKTCALFILGAMQLGEYAPKWDNYTWPCMAVLQMFAFVFYLATGDFKNVFMLCAKEE